MFNASRLWLATDHLLRTELRGFTEMYHRFYFTDIQAILVRPTNRWLVELAVTGLLLMLFLLMSLVTGGAFRVFWLIMAGMVTPFLAGSLVRGRTCVCHIQTAVQLMSLPSVNRYRHARKILGLVEPMIEQAQGTMSTEQMLRELENAPPPVVAQARATAPTGPRVDVASQPSEPKVVVVRHNHGRWHEAFFWLLIADALLTIVGFVMDGELIESLEWLLFFVLLGCGVTALVKQYRTDLPKRLKQCLWAASGAYAVFIASAILYAVILLIDGDFSALEDLDSATDPVILWMEVIFVTVMMPLAGLALVSLYRFRREHAVREQHSTPPPAVPKPAPSMEGLAPPVSADVEDRGRVDPGQATTTSTGTP